MEPGGGVRAATLEVAGHPVALIALSLAVLGRLLDEPPRRQMERRLNASLKGYTVTLQGLDLT